MLTQTNDAIMQHISSCSGVWLILRAIVLQLLVAFLTVNPGLGHIFETESIFTPSYVDSRCALFEEPSAAAQELHREFAQQGRQLLAALWSFARFSLKQEGGSARRVLPVQLPLPIASFFPRKLSPPAADDDPFLS